MNDNTEEKRRFSRVPFDAAVLLTQSNREWRSKLEDISLKGVLISTPDEWDAVAGERFDLEVIFNDSGSLINAEISLVHNEDGHCGFEIIHIDIESVGHLRRLMELNLGDPELLNRELTSLHWK